MEITMRKLILTLVVGLNAWGFTASAAGKKICDIPRSTNLAMDQRDDLREKCLKQKIKDLSVQQCLGVANSMDYSVNAESAREICLYEIKKLTLKECVQITKLMEYPDSGDSSRWECMRRYDTQISKKQCNIIAKSMSYPANSDRAELFCDQKLK